MIKTLIYLATFVTFSVSSFGHAVVTSPVAADTNLICIENLESAPEQAGPNADARARTNLVQFKKYVPLKFFVYDWSTASEHQRALREAAANKAFDARTNALMSLSELFPEIVRDKTVWAFEPAQDILLFTARSAKPARFSAGSLVLVKNDLVVAHVMLNRTGGATIVLGD